MRAWMCTTICCLYDESCAIGATDDECSASRSSGGSGRGISVGFLVSGAAQLTDQGSKTRYRYAFGSAFSSGTHFGGKDLRDARCLSASRDPLVVWEI